jgi:hypothetical protein
VLTALKAVLCALIAAGVSLGQSAYLQSAPEIVMPARIVDGNSPAFWENQRLRVFTSTGVPVSMIGRELDRLRVGRDPVITPADHFPIWIEAVWADGDGTLYGWYHHESSGSCSGLVVPMIGAVVSRDGGRTFNDLGIVLASGDAPNCAARNGYFASGHGDFSVILDQNREYFYFLFTNYGGAASSQGVAVARLAFADRANPVGAVYKYHGGAWTEPGIGGAVTPVFRAWAAWDRADTNSFWGPAVHWNTYLQQYVVLLNHACCATGWPQEGIYIAFNSDVSDPAGWSAPRKIAGEKDMGISPAYYPQVFGTAAPETDSLAGEVGRLFAKGLSRWEIVFSHLPFEPVGGDPEDGSGANRQQPRTELLVQ